MYQEGAVLVAERILFYREAKTLQQKYQFSDSNET
jgi:hypothetical protein